MKHKAITNILPISHFSISAAVVFWLSNSGSTISQPSCSFMLPAISSSPSRPSNFINVLRRISSGRSGYTANACVTVVIVSSGCFLSFGLGEAISCKSDFAGGAGRGGLRSRAPKRSDIRFFRRAVGDPGRWVWSTEETDAPSEGCPPDVITIHIRFQSTCPAMRIRTQPSIRPFTSDDGVSLPGSRVTIRVATLGFLLCLPSLSVIRIKWAV